MSNKPSFNPYKMFVGSFVPNCMLQYDGLSHVAKLCYARMAQYAGVNGEAYPSYNTIAKEIAVSNRTAKRVIKELVDTGFIAIVSRFDDGKQTTNKYIFLWHDIFKDAIRHENTAGGVSEISPGSVSVLSPPPVSKVTPKENHCLRESFKDIKRPSNYTDEFETFWSSYPRKEQKKATLRVWNTNKRKGHSPKDMIKASLNYALHCNNNATSTKYIKLPSTFLGPDEHFVEWIDKEVKYVYDPAVGPSNNYKKLN